VLPAPVVGAPPEQETVIEGWQENPSPQSASTLHGSDQVNVHVDTVWLVQIGSVGHFVSGGQAGVGASTQVVCVWAWQIIPAAQSASTVHGAG